MKSFFVTLSLLLAIGAAQAETALTVRATELQAQAQADAATIAPLSENTKVEVLRRRGAWTEVKTAAGQTGWVRMLSLKPEGSGATQDAGAGSSNPLSGLTNLLSSGRTSNTATVTTGVRGLTKEDIQNAQANPAELQKLQKNSVNKKAGQAFAQHSKLAPAQVEYLTEPAPVRSQSNSFPGG
jgi:hypothetical protein